ncbi:hypothetical protein G7Z17_g4075 [Cylindrodendrum hubeiense]|uniref:DUF3669 domain-containing protein n=1 Tax=Cylindrodendrum hubeiense TaxID=595255 RepID=A0A9P5LA86_9HYPO|nr:hypothetical protein G7Z17_g4075 [Cylindrodendrum hubeiense]
MASTNDKLPSPCQPRCNIQRSPLEVLILGRGHHQSSHNVSVPIQDVTKADQPSSPTRGETRCDHPKPTDYVLVKRKNVYFIATKPTRPALSVEQNLTNPTLQNCAANRLSKFLGSLFDGQGEEPSFLLKRLAATGKSRVYSAEIGNKPTVVKLFNDPRAANNELSIHARVYNELNEFWPLIQTLLQDDRLPRPKVPRPASKVFHRRLLGTSSKVEGFMMEYIQPLNPHHCRVLIKKYLDPQLHEAAFKHPEFLGMRLSVLMGEMSPTMDYQTGKLQDRPVFFDQLWEESPRWVPCWAIMMGATLAIIHWSCGLDARGVEFRLGLHKNQNRLWLSDFGDCMPIEWSFEFVTSNMVNAIMDNPTWPRPATALSLSQMSDPGRVLPQTWNRFRSAYLESSALVLCEGNTYVEDRSLPHRFICRLEAMWELQAEEERARGLA